MCPQLRIHSSEPIDFSESEKRLLCGDPEDPAYQIIPVYQAKYLLQGLLQSKGYSHPRFEYNTSNEASVLDVFPEEISRVEDIVLVTDRDFDFKKIEKELVKRFKKEVLTPKLLDEIELLTKSKIRDASFPCVKVKSLAYATSGRVELMLTDLVSFPFGVLTLESLPGINPKALERFSTFKEDEGFTESDLLLTEKRFIRQGLVQGTYFEESCDLSTKSFSLRQHFIPGDPRTIRLGAGISTELGPMLRASWSHQRFGSMASRLSARLQASLKTQSLLLESDHYFWESTPRRSLNSKLSVERNDQELFRETLTEFSPHVKWTHDTTHRFWLWSLGPSLMASSYQTDLVRDQRSFQAAALNALVETSSHRYEIFDVHPEEGEFAQLNVNYRNEALGFSDRLVKLDLTYLRLLWLGYFGKGSSIAGLRLSTSTTWVKANVFKERLPPSVKFYGGGSDDLRGFKLNSLPDNQGAGALSKVSAKFELRKTHFFEPNLESFAFLDTTLFGERPWRVDPRLWYSPGLGVRWLSPVGLVQTYLARSLSNESSAHFDQDEGLFFYFGLGGFF